MLDLASVVESPAAEAALGGLPPLFGPADVVALRALVSAVRVAPPLKEYIVDIVRATREPGRYGLDLGPMLELGASPRATIALVRAARGHALLSGRDYVTPHDVKRLALDVLRHRIIISSEAEAEGLSADEILAGILERIQVP
jgi:MoxR-like ATPase